MGTFRAQEHPGQLSPQLHPHLKSPLAAGVHRLQGWVWAVWQLVRGRNLSPALFDLYYFIRRDPWGYRSSPLEQGKYRDILSLLPPAPIARALEIGCAEGVFTDMLATRVDSLTAIDSSPTALQRARKSLVGYSQVEFQLLNIAHENPTGEFDLIVASEVLYYLGGVDQISRVGRRMLDWLKPGGYILLCHMRSQSDEAAGFPVPRWTPGHPGACTVHGIFDHFTRLYRLAEVVHPLYRVGLYRLAAGAKKG